MPFQFHTEGWKDLGSNSEKVVTQLCRSVMPPYIPPDHRYSQSRGSMALVQDCLSNEVVDQAVS